MIADERGRMKVCTVQGCRIPISQSQEFCARCWNNTPRRYRDDYKIAYDTLVRAEGAYETSVRVIRTAAAKELEPR
jgi:hypothetical protein